MSFRARAVLACATLSGACGLTYEVIWLKDLGLWLGQTTAAVALLVGAFLGGLVLGSLLLGPRADRVARPLVLFAVLEACTAVLGAGVTHGLGWLIHAGLGVSGPLPARAVEAFVVVLLPTFAMGGTLPALARAVTSERSHLGVRVGLVYAFNTFGAAVGCLTAGLWVIGRLGISATGELAAVGNLLVAAAALLLARGEGTAHAAPQEAAPVERDARLPGTTVLLVAFAVSGVTSISYENLWFRLLASFLPASTYTFSILLSTFLLGLVLGGFWYAARLARGGATLARFGELQFLLAVSALLSLVLLGEGRVFKALLPGGDRLAALAMALLTVLPPCVVLGAVFPLVTDLSVEKVATLGSRIGWLYSASTLGGIVGSLSTGFVLVPVFGTQRTYAVMLLLNVGLALWGLWRAGERRRTRLLALGLVPLGLLVLPSSFVVRGIGAFDDSRTLEVREGRDGTLAVLEYDQDTVCGSKLHDCSRCAGQSFHHRQLIFGSVSYASTVMPAKRYMRALAHLPMMLHPAPRDVLQICFGTGTTASSFVQHPELRSLTIADLNSDVFAMAPYFAESNRGVLKDPRVVPVVEDGRHYLAASREVFDVISLEPPPPTAAGAVSLYSREFYQLARARLGPNGVLAQWMPVEQQSDRVNRMLLKTMLETFDDVTLWMPSRLEGVAVGSVGKQEIDLERLEQRWSPQVAADFHDVGVEGVTHLSSSLMMNRAELEKWVGDAPAVTDDFPAVEHFMAHEDHDFELGALDHPAFDARLSGLHAAQLELTRAHAASRHGDLETARSLVTKVAPELGEPAYTDYLLSLEYGCLQKR